MSTLLPIHLLACRLQPARNVTEGDVVAAQSRAQLYLAHDQAQQLDHWRKEAFALLECGLTPLIVVAAGGSTTLVFLTLIVDLFMAWLTDLIKLAWARHHAQQAMDTLFDLGEVARLAKRLSNRSASERVLRHRFARFVPDAPWQLLLSTFALGFHTVLLPLFVVLALTDLSFWRDGTAWLAALPIVIRGASLLIDFRSIKGEQTSESGLTWAPQTHGLLLVSYSCLISLLPLNWLMERWLGKGVVPVGALLLAAFATYSAVVAAVGYRRITQREAHLRWLAQTPLPEIWPAAR
ncbi:hypothetical protein [Pseudomarimonas arenosa]|uniref:Uncharacterized protein n=1 Tax=Pseudomarimonas arenosa TaxID=2774145 RepID=A0AAW3ZGU4_9GAMM|nr:hypothetical protein [Pseudomarimonas arenosa]MBD8524499.1 hypothetical protein [Pseudomarimonas arenosa]